MKFANENALALARVVELKTTPSAVQTVPMQIGGDINQTIRDFIYVGHQPLLGYDVISVSRIWSLPSPYEDILLVSCGVVGYSGYLEEGGEPLYVEDSVIVPIPRQMMVKDTMNLCDLIQILHNLNNKMGIVPQVCRTNAPHGSRISLEQPVLSLSITNSFTFNYSSLPVVVLRYYNHSDVNSKLPTLGSFITMLQTRQRKKQVITQLSHSPNIPGREYIQSFSDFYKDDQKTINVLVQCLYEVIPYQLRTWRRTQKAWDTTPLVDLLLNFITINDLHPLQSKKDLGILVDHIIKQEGS